MRSTAATLKVLVGNKTMKISLNVTKDRPLETILFILLLYSKYDVELEPAINCKITAGTSFTFVCVVCVFGRIFSSMNIHTSSTPTPLSLQQRGLVSELVSEWVLSPGTNPEKHLDHPYINVNHPKIKMSLLCFVTIIIIIINNNNIWQLKLDFKVLYSATHFGAGLCCFFSRV